MNLLFFRGKAFDRYGCFCASPQSVHAEPDHCQNEEEAVSTGSRSISEIVLFDLYKNHRQTIYLSLKRLANLCYHDDHRTENRFELFQRGGFVSILSAMRKWMDCADVLAEGCRALQNCIAESNEFRDYAVKIGALEVVTKAMNRHSKERYLQRVACGALHSLCQDSFSKARRLVLKLNGVRLIVAAMEAYPESRRLQMWGCCCLDNLSQHDSLRVRMIGNDALRVLETAAKNYPSTNHPEIELIHQRVRHAKENLSLLSAKESF